MDGGAERCTQAGAEHARRGHAAVAPNTGLYTLFSALPCSIEAEPGGAGRGISKGVPLGDGGRRRRGPPAVGLLRFQFRERRAFRYTHLSPIAVLA